MLAQSNSPAPAGPLPDPVSETRRIVDAATAQGLIVRVLGGVAVCLQTPDGGPLPVRKCGDIDLATGRESRRATAALLSAAGYIADEMFNALHGARRLAFYDQANNRKVDVFVGEFSMCHVIPLTERLDREPLTVPLAELILTKLQIVELNERDQRDIYNLTYFHHMSDGDGSGIEADFIADLCAKDWGLWRTSRATIEKCQANIAGYALADEVTRLISERLETLRKLLDNTPKSTRWRLRSRIGDRMRWYEEPEETANSQ